MLNFSLALRLATQLSTFLALIMTPLERFQMRVICQPHGSRFQPIALGLLFGALLKTYGIDFHMKCITVVAGGKLSMVNFFLLFPCE